MPETKTFVNPYLDYNTDSWHADEWGWEIDGEVFREAEWDLTVTMTKKVRQLKAGDKVTYSLWHGDPAEWEVVAVCRDMVFIDDGNKPWAVPISDVLAV